MRVQSLVACLLVPAGLFACAETVDLCDSGFARNTAGECVAAAIDGSMPIDAGRDARPPQDTGVDAGPPPDGGSDGGPDAGPCGGCEEGLFCTEDNGCVECDDSTPCADGFCSAIGMCVECRTSGDCTTDLAAPICSAAGMCQACSGSSECGADVCAPTGECVGCLDETDCVVGGDMFVCDRIARTCTARLPGLIPDCEACVSDADCLDGVCARELFRGRERGFVCARPKDTGLGENCVGERPYRRLVETTDIEGGGLSVCLPSSVTCQSVVDYDTDCVASSECGSTDADDTGQCRSEVLAGNMLCTYTCSRDEDCEISMECHPTQDICSYPP